ncbi:hypothetical protein GCM10011297_21180 [Bacterioplanes sanyensis]|uniref:hypothetical protein n=1 Tax=Bacterioplanes sanyensis TaxID=1249553 RepID=UPI00167AFA5D|nr:hypothetical protein [Bacterioplanes sanyensis]GGY48060.1 hypothetical protein GCM10011297_21180 [Bacterioplanes sanyensis]
MPVLLQLSKVLQALALLITALVGAQVMMMGTWLALGLAVLLTWSIFWPMLHRAAVWAGRAAGVLALILLALLLAAGDVREGHHLSSDYQIIATGLFFIAGLSILLWLFAPVNRAGQ